MERWSRTVKLLSNSKAWLESVTDTIVGTCINFPLNIVILYITTSMGLSVFATAVTMTSVFTFFAIVRKYFIRTYFSRKRF